MNMPDPIGTILAKPAARRTAKERERLGQFEEFRAEVHRFFERHAPDDVRRLDAVLERLVDEPDAITEITKKPAVERTPEELAALKAYGRFPDWCRLLEALNRCAATLGVVGRERLPRIPLDIGTIAQEAGIEWTVAEERRFTEWLFSHLAEIMATVLVRLRDHAWRNGGDRDAIDAVAAEDAWAAFLAPNTPRYAARLRIAEIEETPAAERTPTERRTVRLFAALRDKVSVDDDSIAVGLESVLRRGLRHERLADRARACLDALEARDVRRESASDRADRIAPDLSDDEIVGFIDRLSKRLSEPDGTHELRVLMLASLRIHVVDRCADPNPRVGEVDLDEAWRGFVPIGVKACGGSAGPPGLDRFDDRYLPGKAPAPTRALVETLNTHFETPRADILVGQVMGGYLWGLLLARTRIGVYPQLDGHCLATARRLVGRREVPLEDGQLAGPADGGNGEVDLSLPADAGPADLERLSAAIRACRAAISSHAPWYAACLGRLADEQQFVHLASLFNESDRGFMSHGEIAGTVSKMREVAWVVGGRRGARPEECTQVAARQMASRARIDVMMGTEAYARQTLALPVGMGFHVDTVQPIAETVRTCAERLTRESEQTDGIRIVAKWLEE